MDLSKQIIYEDADILAINKPAGLIVHPDGRTKEASVSEWLITKYPTASTLSQPLSLSRRGVDSRAASGGEVYEVDETEWSGIVHRLDKETSGVLLLAKTNEGLKCLKEQFKNREIQKIYYVFVYGNLKEDHGTLSLPIGKSPSDFRKYSAGRGATGLKREATTYFQVLKRGEGVTLVEARPKTGRTHQIRVHFTALQRPVIGDKLYASTKSEMLSFKRLALHAREITFKDTKGGRHSVSAEFPEDFINAFDTIGYKPKDLP